MPSFVCWGSLYMWNDEYRPPTRAYDKQENLALLSVSWSLFHLYMIPMALYVDNIPYFDEKIHVDGCNPRMEWSPLKSRTPKVFTIFNFGHTVSKFWLLKYKYWFVNMIIWTKFSKNVQLPLCHFEATAMC